MHVVTVNRLLLAFFLTLLFCLMWDPAAGQPSLTADSGRTERLLARSSTGDPIHHATLVVTAGGLSHVVPASLRRLIPKAVPCMQAQAAVHSSASALGPTFLPPSNFARPPSKSVSAPLLI